MFERNYLKYQEDQSSPALGTKQISAGVTTPSTYFFYPITSPTFTYLQLEPRPAIITSSWN